MTTAKVLPTDSTEAPSHPRDAMEARMTCCVWFLTVLLSPLLAIAFVLRVLLLLVTCFVLMPLSMALPRSCALRVLPTIGRLLFLVFGVRWTIFGARLLACLLAVWPGLLFKRRGPPSPV